MPDKASRIALLYQQATHALVIAQQWLRDADSKEQREFANTAIRHARGLQVAAAAGKQATQIES